MTTTEAPDATTIVLRSDISFEITFPQAMVTDGTYDTGNVSGGWAPTNSGLEVPYSMSMCAGTGCAGPTPPKGAFSLELTSATGLLTMSVLANTGTAATGSATVMATFRL